VTTYFTVRCARLLPSKTQAPYAFSVKAGGTILLPARLQRQSVCTVK
jgi:hypothetical protein